MWDLSHSPESNAKRAEKLRGRPRSEECRRKMSEANMGKHLSEECRRKISESLKGRKAWNKGIKTGLIPWNKGSHMDEEMKSRLSEIGRAQDHGQKPVLMFTKSGEPLAEFESLSAAARATGLRVDKISEVANCKPKRNSVCGYVFRFKQKD